MRRFAATLALLLLARAADAQVNLPMKDPPKLTVSVTMKEAPSKGNPLVILRTITGAGDAAYPDGTALQFGVRLKEDQNFIVRSQGFVNGGKWEIELPPFGNDIYHGMYVCEVAFDPELQAPGIVPKLPADKRMINRGRCDQKIGTDAEIAKEREEALGYYKARLIQIRGIFDSVEAEYQAQLAGKDQEKWRKFVVVTQEKMTEVDNAMAAWSKRKRNVLNQETFEALTSVVLTLKDYAMDAYTAGLAFHGGRVPKGSGPEDHQQTIRALLEKADKALADVKPQEPPKEGENPK